LKVIIDFVVLGIDPTGNFIHKPGCNSIVIRVVMNDQVDTENLEYQ
jgi:hypothetical protein